jgi:hypothetical protein
VKEIIMLDWIIGRLREPSTYAGFSALALTVGLSAEEWQAVSTLVAALAGAVAVFVTEKA